MKRRYIVIFLGFLIAGGLFAETQSQGNSKFTRYALFIGSNKGGEGRQELAYATKDASEMSQVLGEMGGIPRRNNILLKDPDAGTIDDAFFSIKESMGNSDETGRIEFILYYSGHSDEEGILLGTELYTYKKLRDNIQAIDADVRIAILDSCYSGAFTRLKGGVRRTPFLVDESVDTKGYAYLTSSSENEAAQESDAIEGSFFTHYFIAALRGAADATSQDMKITLNEAYSYASGETLARTENTLAGPQHAMYDMNLTGSGDLVLTDLRTTDAAVELKRDISGRLFIRDSNGNLIAEIKKMEGIPMSLALPPGYYSTTLQSRDDILEADLILRRGKNTVLAGQDFTPVVPEDTRVRGNAKVAESEEIVETDEVKEEFKELPAELDDVKQDALEAIETLKRRLNKNKNAEEAPAGDGTEASAPAEDNDIELVHVYNSFGLLPQMNINKGIVAHNISIHLIDSVYRVKGFELGIVNLVDENVRGVQIGSVMSLVGGSMYGFQGSGILNLSDGNFKGAQTAGVFNLSGGNVSFFQSAGIFNMVGGNMSGLQFGGIFNTIDKNMKGFQAAGVFNAADGESRSFQAAGVFNTAGQMNGLQIAGVFNAADSESHALQIGGVFNNSDQFYGMQIAGLFNACNTMHGAQIGTVNVSGNTKGLQAGVLNIGGDTAGVQIGLVNIAKEMNGLAFGLVNISSNGLHHPSTWFDNMDYMYTGYQMGSRPLYTILYFGIPYEDGERPLISGLGMGMHLEKRALFLDLDITAKNVAGGVETNEKASRLFNYQYDTVFPYVRATLGLKIGKRLAVIGGVGADVHLPGVTKKNEIFHDGEDYNTFKYSPSMESAQLYPKWFIGLRI